MDVREKLVELLADAGMGKPERNFLADQLIANGVTVQERNDPITMDELRKMDGEPVWVCFNGVIVREDGWFIITETEKCEVLLKGKASVYKSFEYYGKTWMAYRQKPKGE